MSVRRSARLLLASVFVSSGIDALMHLERRTESAAVLLRNVERVSPDRLTPTFTSKPGMVVRITTTTQIVGGVLLALGTAPRLAAAGLALTVIPSSIAEQDFWAEKDPDRKAAKRAAFLKDLGLLGGLMIAAVDTEGRPSLAWRGRRAAHRVADAVSAALLSDHPHNHGDNLSHRLHETAEQGHRLADISVDKAREITEAAWAHARSSPTRQDRVVARIEK